MLEPNNPLCPQCERPIQATEPMTYPCIYCRKLWEALYMGQDQGWTFREVLR